MRDNLEDDPVVVAALTANGTDLDRLEWKSTTIRDEGHYIEQARSGGPSDVRNAHSAGACDVRVKRHMGLEGTWVATVHRGDIASYHAQRGHRTMTLRAVLPGAVAAALVGRPGSAVCDMPGLEHLVVTAVDDHAMGHTIHLGLRGRD